VSIQSELAWANITHNVARTAAGVAGVAFAVVLLFMQLGFYDTSYRSSTLLFDELDFDIVLRSPQYAHVRAAGTVPRRRLYQAEAVHGVAAAMPLYVGNGTYQEPESGLRREIVVLAVDPRREPFKLPALVANGPRLAEADTAIMDATVGPDYEPVRAGSICMLENRRIDIVGVYHNGTGFIGDASVYVSDQTFSRLFGNYPLSDVSLGLIKLAPDANVNAVISELRAELPDDVQVMQRRELETGEQRLWVRTRPVGVMFSSGVILAVLVGAVIVYQILSAEITNRLKEYATLKAIGHEFTFIRDVVIRQALLYALMGAVPATVVAYGLYYGLERATNLPMVMTVARLVLVACLAAGMSVGAALLAIRRVGRTDPADLF
jgi:putative ABC transport system permease protein